MLNHTIKTLDELEFAVFCIENVAARIGIHAEGGFLAVSVKYNSLEV